MISALLITLLLQTVALIPRAGLANPAVAYPVPKKLQKDYDKLWQRFAKGKEDDKVMKDTDKLLKKNSDVVSLTILEAYLDLYAHRTSLSESKFEQILSASPENKIALSFLSDFAFNREEYSRAYDLYTRLLKTDPSRTDVEPKLQKALLRATQDLIVSASRAEQAGRVDEAESQYRRALQLAPQEPSLHEKLGELYARQMKWDLSYEEFRKTEEFGSPSDDVEHHIAEALINLGRPEEARGTLERLKKSGVREDGLESKINELEDLGRWGSDLPAFRLLQVSPAITRSQLALLLVRYFPQISDGRGSSVIMTDVTDNALLAAIQTVVGNGLMDVRPNRTFQPNVPLMRGEFASALARLITRLNLPTSSAPPVPLADVGSGNRRYRDIQQVLAHGLMTLDDNGNFNVNGNVSGEEAVRAVRQMTTEN